MLRRIRIHIFLNSYLLMKILIIFLYLLFTSVNGFSQNKISGKITDQKTNEPLESVAVTAIKSGRVTTTDGQGNFKIDFTGDSCLVNISMIGYRSKAIELTHHFSFIHLERGPVDLKEVIITPQMNTYSQHNLSAIDLHLRPVNSSQDLMRLVPGLFLGEHHGGGIAEHIFFRGFDADHGTDVNVSVDDMPVNLVSQAHGQGFSDLHFIIPELVTRYEFGKGPYYADHGDFTTAGYVAFHTADVLDKSTVKIEGGQFNTGRILGMFNLLSDKAKHRGESAYLAGEGSYTDGPFDFPQHFGRINLFGKYNVNLSSKQKLTITLSSFTSKWRSSGGIPERAVDEGLIDRFGYVDSVQGGNTNRANIIAKLNSSLSDDLSMENQVYYSRYHFDHHYDDTFFAADSINGDRMKQHEDRDLFGYNGKISHHAWFKNNVELVSSAGLGWQLNKIYNSELSHTDINYKELEYLQLGNIDEMSANGYINENLRFGKWLLNGGMRFDCLYFSYDDKLNPEMPSRSKAIVSPKLNVEYTANSTVQVYLKTGKGFHSNDAKVVVANDGHEVLPAAYGTDIGINWKPVSHLYINTALWYLYLQQEFVYNGDDGTLEPSDKTRRMGIDFSARYQFNKWLFGVVDANLSKARDIQAPKGSDYVPLSVPLSSTGGLDFKFANGFNGGISYRYMKNRPANEDNSLIAKGYFVNDLTAYYTKHKYEVGVEIQNLFNVKWREEQFEVESRLKGEPAPVDDVNFTSGTPFFAKLKFAVFF